jgi:hypothetical protein
LPADSDQGLLITIDMRYAMPPKKRGGPVRPVVKEYGKPAETGERPAFAPTPASLEAAPEAMPEAILEAGGVPAELAAGTASIEEEISPFQQSDSEAEVPPAAAPIPPPPAVEEHALAEVMDGNAGNAPLAPLDEVVSTSASLIGSVAGGIGLASIIGGGLVVIGLGAAVGAWYSVALANNYLSRRWGTGNKGAA